MINLRRRKSWNLSPRDLPHPSVIKDERLLQDLENNAAFRMLRFHSKSSKSGDYGTLLQAVTFILLFRFGLLPAIAALIVLIIAETIWKQSRQQQSMHLKGLNRQMLADLHSAAFPPSEILGAVWACALPRSSGVSFYSVMLTITLATFSAAAYLIYPLWIWLGVPFVMLSAHNLVERRHMPYASLPQLKKIVDAAALNAGCWSPPARTAKGCARELILFTTFVAVCVGIGLILLNPPTIDFGTYMRLGETILSHPATVVLVVVGSLAVGFLMGNRRGFRLKHRKDKIAARLEIQIRNMLELASKDIA